MPDVPLIEPTEIVAGLTYKWRREDLVSDYPASTWTLTYYFVGPTLNSFTATADGNDFAVTLSASETLGLLPGRYTLFARVSDGTELYEVYKADVVVTEDPTNVVAGTDQRSWARITRDNLRAAILGSSDSLILNYSIGGAGRTIGKMSAEERLLLLDYFEAKVLREEEQAAIDAGRGNPRRIQVRFTRP